VSIWWLAPALVAFSGGTQALQVDTSQEKAAKPQAGLVMYEDIRPLLEMKCFRCHGEKSHKGELDLRSMAGVLKGGESGDVVVPSKPNESLLFEKVRDGAMPPGKKDKLGEAEVESIRRWIADGARVRSSETTESALSMSQHDVIPILLRRCAPCHGSVRKE